MIRLFTTAVLPGAGVVPGNGQPAFGSAPVLVSSMALMLLPSTSIDNNEPDLPLGSEFDADAETSVDFRITNPTGTGPLAVSTPVVSAAVNCAVTVDPAPAASVAAGGQTEFTLNITPADAGAFSFTLTIANDSPDKNPFVVNFSGTAVALSLGFTPLGDFDADANVTVADTDKVVSWANNGSVLAAGATLINNGTTHRPTLITADADFNGHKSVSFNGSNHLYENGNNMAAAMLNADAKHAFVVMTVETYAASRYVFNDGTPVFGLRLNGGANGLEAFNQDSGGVDATPAHAAPSVSTPALVEVLHDGVNLKIKVGNGSYQSVASGNTAGAGFGAYFEVGHSADNPATKLTGKISRLILHDTVKTGADLERIRSYLAYRYGVAA